MTLQLDFCTLFPDFFTSPLNSSILRRAAAQGQVSYQLHNIRDWAHDKHKTADDRPFGGGPGMVLKPEPIFALFEALALEPGTPVVLTCPRAPLFQQEDALMLARQPRVVFLCGHYEGIDERVREQLCSHLYAIGSYVLTGGEPAALVMADAIVRLVPGVVGCPESIEQESFQEPLLDCPHYTRPAVFRDWAVPEVLLGGNHAAIARWRREQQLKATLQYRPDLLARAELSPDEQRWLEQLRQEVS